MPPKCKNGIQTVTLSLFTPPSHIAEMHLGALLMTITALIVAAGKGERAGGGLPKQYQRVASVALVAHAVDSFRAHPAVDRIMIVIGEGHLTGITLTGEFPHSGYEIQFEAARLAGRDFFAGLTFPVNDTFCTWINGGWGGAVVGLSSLDGDDASENDTNTARDFVMGRWYAFRLRVTVERIQAWIDGNGR